MTEEVEKTELSDDIPPRPWQVTHVADANAWTVCDANDALVIDWVDCTPSKAVADLIVTVVNDYESAGWLEPVSEFYEKLYNDKVEADRTFMLADARIQAALRQIEKFRNDGMITIDHAPQIARLESPAELLDILHDVLSGGGGMLYTPCRYAVIPDVGEDGMCVAHATEEFKGKRYCKPHAEVLEHKYGDAPV